MNDFNYMIFVLLTILYGYQALYILISLFLKEREPKAKQLHKYAVVIAARNEEKVIGELLKSIQHQKYPKELVDTFVIADNCTDNTARVAKEAGAFVCVRDHQNLVGKGYALDFLFERIAQDHSDKEYEGYFVFDADNLLDENYIQEMNKLFDEGYRILTSYRNSKNYDTNWISAGYSLWFLREARYVNHSRMILGTSCAVSGTGFLVHQDIIHKNHGWKFHLLTEDIEFSAHSAILGESIGYCKRAKLYDEQPINFQQSWDQRMRWAKGFYQVFLQYGKDLAKTAITAKNFSCYDLLMTVSPALLLTFFTLLVNGVILSLGVLWEEPYTVMFAMEAIVSTLLKYYGLLWGIGLLTTITEWREIHCSPLKKIWYVFTFPFFIFTYIPISIAALFQKVQWKPIYHNVVKSMDQIRQLNG
jgi:cellulose synthase/poly-beta-1,6-N-acetylglucosamine synthase-like glycosyltransferase